MHLVDGIKIELDNDLITIVDGEGKPIIDTNGHVNMPLLEEFIWTYKIQVEYFYGSYSEIFIDRRNKPCM